MLIWPADCTGYGERWLHLEAMIQQRTRCMAAPGGRTLAHDQLPGSFLSTSLCRAL